MSEPEQKCENNAVFKQNYTAKLLITFKMAYSCCFSLGGNLDFLTGSSSRRENVEYEKVK